MLKLLLVLLFVCKPSHEIPIIIDNPGADLFKLADVDYLENSADALIRRPRGCIQSLNLIYCTKDVNVRRTHYYYEDKVVVESDCKKLHARSIIWELYEKSTKKTSRLRKFRNKQVAIITKHDVKAGDYVFTVAVTDYNGTVFNKSCLLRYLNEPPEIKFKKGHTQSVSPGARFTIDITDSKFMEGLTAPRWTTLCRRVSSQECGGASCIFPAKGLKFNAQTNPCIELIEFTATVIYDNEKVSATQLVYVANSSMKTKITCVENCDIKNTGITLRENDVVLKVECLRNCANFDSVTIKWKIRKNMNDAFNTRTVTVSGDTKTFTIEASTLTVQNGFYYVFATAAGKVYNVFGLLAPEFNAKCAIAPTSGYSLETVFTLKCNYTGYFKTHIPFIEVYQTRKGVKSLMLITATANDEVQLYVEGWDQPVVRVMAGFHDEKLIFIKLRKPIYPKVTTRVITEEYITDLLKRMQKTTKEGDTSMTTQLIKGILLALVKKEVSEDFTANALMLVMKSLQKVPVRTLYDYKLVTQTTAQLLDIDILGKTYDMLTATCKTIASLKTTDFIKSKYGAEQEQTVPYYVRLIDNCAGRLVSIGDTEELVQDTHDEDAFSEIIPENVIVEDYKDYDSNLNSMENKLKKMDALDVLKKATLTLAETIRTGANPQVSVVFSRKVLKHTGKNMADQNIDVEGILVSPGADLEKNYESRIISAVVTSFKRDFLDKAVLATNIADVNYYEHVNKTVVKVHPEYNITFDVITDIKKFDEYNVTTPADKNSWTLPSIDYNMNVHRLNMVRSSSCFVKFQNLTTNATLQVVLTRNRRPRLQDYDGKVYTVNESDASSLMIKCPDNESQDRNRYIYVAVLPGSYPQTLTVDDKVSLNYFVQFTEQSCVTFDNISMLWTPADCKISFYYEGPSPKIQCICKHTSLFAGTHKRNTNKLDQVQVVEFNSTEFVNYTIFIHVAAVFAAYCLALAFMPLRTHTPFGIDKVIFLSDNRKNDRYAYLLVVKTGSLVFSGTTSNVMVKLHGDLDSSEPHVLNYPDPDKRLLQRDREDWFILTSLMYLGKIHEIEIWVDIIGFRPVWYCENVVVIDLQNRTQWYFKVDRWFTLSSESSYIAKIPFSDVNLSRNNLVGSIQKNVRIYFGAENTWNIFSSLQDETLTYYERLTVLLSMIYTTFAFLVIFLNPPKWKSSDAFGYGRFGIHFETVAAILGASAAANLINGPIAYVFKNSTKRRNVNSLLNEESMFTQKVSNITWGVLCSWIVICMTYLLLCGNWVPYHTSHVWILCSLCSLLFSALVLENFYIIISKVITDRYKKIPKRYYDYNRIIIEVERQRKVLFRMFGELLLRTYFKKQYKKIPWETYIQRKQLEMERSEVIAQIKNMILFLVFLVLAYILTFIGSNPIIYKANRMMEKMMAGTFGANHMLLRDVNSTNDIYMYINKTLIPMLHPSKWYGNHTMQDPGLMADYNTKILGLCQLRQQRRNQTCQLPEMMNMTWHHCSNEVPEIFGQSQYNDGSKISDAVGVMDKYKGDGYVIHLGRTRRNSKFILDMLKRNNWLDTNTKVLFIEFWTYNANNNLFNAVRVMIERDPSGYIATSTEITTARLIYQSLFMEIFTLFLLGAMLLVICVMLGSGIWVIVKKHKNYFENLWNAFDFLLVVQALAVISLIYIRNKQILVLLKKLEESNHNSFVNYFEVFQLMETNNALMGTLLCLGTIRAWKYLRFTKVFRLMERSIRNGAKETAIVMLYHIIVFIMYSVLFNQTIGNTVSAFQHFSRSLLTVFLISLNVIRGLQQMNIFTSGVITYIFYALFMVISVAFYSVYSTIFMNAYAESKIYFSNRRRQYNLKDYVSDEFTYYSEIARSQKRFLRLKGGATEEVAHKFVHPKAPPQRYADAVMLSEDKMTAMRLIAICVVSRVIRFGKRQLMTDQDYEITLGIIKLLNNLKKPRGGEKNKLLQQIFFAGRDARQPVKNVTFVSNIKLLQMEYIVEKLLRRESVSASELAETDHIHMSGDEERLDYYKNAIELITRAVNRIQIRVDITS